jgi:hypothetical protein
MLSYTLELVIYKLKKVFKNNYCGGQTFMGCPFIEKKIIDKFDKFLQFIDKFLQFIDKFR